MFVRLIVVAVAVAMLFVRPLPRVEAAETAMLIDETKELATNIGIQGTPAYIIGTTLVPGAIGLEGLRQVIAETRATN